MEKIVISMFIALACMVAISSAQSPTPSPSANSTSPAMSPSETHSPQAESSVPPTTEEKPATTKPTSGAVNGKAAMGIIISFALAALF